MAPVFRPLAALPAALPAALLAALLAAIIALPAAGATTEGLVPDRVISGTGPGGLAWAARSLIVGATSTAVASNGGDPLFFPTMPRHSGMAQLSATFTGIGTFSCSGTLLSDRIHVVTAAHCLSYGAGGWTAASATVRFYGGSNPDTLVSSLSGSSATHAAIAADTYFVHPSYTGQVVDENDIAVIRLASAAPSWVTTHEIDWGGALGGQSFEVGGYGRRSANGGSTGSVANSGGRLRVGTNSFDFRMGDPALNNAFMGYFGSAAWQHTWLSDFDSGLTANDAACIVAGFCNLGTGVTEVSTAQGDSGGGAFIAERLVAIVSFGLSLGTDSGDVDSSVNSTFGEFNGYVPLSRHRDFVGDIIGLDDAVPEPASWAMLLAGFALTGTRLRRQRRLLAVA